MISLFGDGSFDGNQDFPWCGPGRLAVATFVRNRESLYSALMVYSGEFEFAWQYCRGLAVEDANEPPRPVPVGSRSRRRMRA